MHFESEMFDFIYRNKNITTNVHKAFLKQESQEFQNMLIRKEGPNLIQYFRFSIFYCVTI